LDVVPVRVLVVRDVEVEPPVAVQSVKTAPSEWSYGAGRARPARRPRGTRASVRAVALVQEEQVAHAEVVGRVARHRAGDRAVRLRVAGDEEVRAPVAVDVATAAPECQPKETTPDERAPSVNVPSPLFQRSLSSEAVVTKRSV
jgi:hypothetical protein